MGDTTHATTQEGSVEDAGGRTRVPTEAGGPVGSRGRRIAFRVVAVLTSLWVLATAIFGLMEPVLMWLPQDTLLGIVGEDGMPAMLDLHRGHFNAAGIVAWALVLGVVVQLRKPVRRVAGMLQAVGIVVAGTVLYGLSGTLTDWVVEEWTLLVPVVAMAVLHPGSRDLVRRPGLDRTMVGLVALAAGPWLVSIANHAVLQFRNLPDDSHAQMEHWATAALLGVVVLWCGLLGATDHDGWRLPAFVTVFAAVDFGVFSLVFPDTASAAAPILAVGSIAWGVAYGVLAWGRSRAVAPDANRRGDESMASPGR